MSTLTASSISPSNDTPNLSQLGSRLSLAHYKGDLKDALPHGDGEYRLLDSSIYRGSFHQGLFHGHGVVTLPNGDHFDAQWSLGRLVEGSYQFADGLEYPLQGRSEDWRYCTDADRRYWHEHAQGIALVSSSSPEALARASNRAPLPYRTFDVGDGYLVDDSFDTTAAEHEHIQSGVYDFVTGLWLRETNASEIAWARSKCRVGDDASVTRPAIISTALSTNASIAVGRD